MKVGDKVIFKNPEVYNKRLKQYTPNEYYYHEPRYGVTEKMCVGNRTVFINDEYFYGVITREISDDIVLIEYFNTEGKLSILGYRKEWLKPYITLNSVIELVDKLEEKLLKS